MDNTKEYIICAAIWFKDMELKNPDILKHRGAEPYNIDVGIVLCGWRHLNCIRQFNAITGLPMSKVNWEDGFLTSKNMFIDRKEGGKLAFEVGQTEELKKTLYSEDIY